MKGIALSNSQKISERKDLCGDLWIIVRYGKIVLFGANTIKAGIFSTFGKIIDVKGCFNMAVNDVVKILNAFLKGQYMGIHAYEHCIEKLKDPNIKKEFQNIQQDHKIHALKVAERIQNLWGIPVDNEGIVGSVQGFIGQFMIPH